MQWFNFHRYFACCEVNTIPFVLHEILKVKSFRFSVGIVLKSQFFLSLMPTPCFDLETVFNAQGTFLVKRVQKREVNVYEYTGPTLMS